MFFVCAGPDVCFGPVRPDVKRSDLNAVSTFLVLLCLSCFVWTGRGFVAPAPTAPLQPYPDRAQMAEIFIEIARSAS